MIHNSISSNDAVIMISDKRLSIVFGNTTESDYVISKYSYYYTLIDNNPNMLNVTKPDENNKVSKYGIKYKTPFVIIINSKNLYSKFFNNIIINTKKSYEVNDLINSTFETKPITSYTFIIDDNSHIKGFTSGFYYSIRENSYQLYNITEFIDDESYTLVNITGMDSLYCFTVSYDVYNIYCTNKLSDLKYHSLTTLYESNYFTKYSKLCILIFNYYYYL